MSRPGAAGADLNVLAEHLAKEGVHKSLASSRRVRVIFNSTIIVDSTKGVFVWEHPWYPQYYFPSSEIRNANIEEAKDGVSPVQLTVTARPEDGIEERSTERVLRFSLSAKPTELAGLVRLEFSAMDQWLEEDVPIYVHPKDPFKRIDILPSTRAIEIRLQGKTICKSSFAMHLFETGLPTRYYLPLGCVDASLLRRSELVTKCPYKGEAEYYHVVVDGKVHENIVWYYRNPIQESIAIAGLICFYNEKVEVLLDGSLY